jgi:endonuclease/exonuclease/phosphatase family metal-dependent hydrolase
MAHKPRNLFKRFMMVFTVLIMLAYLLVCLVPFLASGDWWFIAMLGLGFPLLAVLLILFTIGWALARSKWVFACLAALLLGWQQLSVIVKLRSGSDFSIAKDGETLRVMSWNVSRWDELNKRKKGGSSFRQQMLDVIQMQGADVLCIQEFFESYDPRFTGPNIPVIMNMGYPYFYFFPTSKMNQDKMQFGLCIFSRYPIVDSAQFRNGAGEHGEGFCYVDIKANASTYRIFTTHLESAGLGRRDYESPGEVKASRKVLSKIRHSYEVRNTQADGLRQEMDKSPHPVILCGDLNDVPNSYVYFKTKGGLRDAFLVKGAGLGRTFRHVSPTLRIDYIFADKGFRVEQFGRVEVKYSDHFPILADLHFSGK